MEKWGSWWWCKNTFLFPTKRIVFTITSRLTLKPKGRKNGLMNIYKELESCSGYEDIQVMWEILHSTCPPNNNNKRSSSHWRLCFKPT
ncbi:hypothetical protein GIB67_038939 [Kingdonia uniflora]|uniref:Uncharacterized protein n=1 Tax=Kingdonia uniflora TaxID=39325 RepID=A0A7J7LQL1_9MAGN|nr:hypothetical protein GIB67_038939 [Kingdonia uniflora]